jgi:hypothetical protein
MSRTASQLPKMRLCSGLLEFVRVAPAYRKTHCLGWALRLIGFLADDRKPGPHARARYPRAPTEWHRVIADASVQGPPRGDDIVVSVGTHQRCAERRRDELDPWGLGSR